MARAPGLILGLDDRTPLRSGIGVLIHGMDILLVLSRVEEAGAAGDQPHDAASEPRESPVSASEEPASSPPPEPDRPAEKPSWLKRFFGLS
jgi:hypothetical protein